MKNFIATLFFLAPMFPAAAQETPPAAETPAAPVAPVAPAATATLHYKSTGDAMWVRFYNSTNSAHCAELTESAGVYDAELLRKKLLGFIAKTVQKANAGAKVYPEAEKTVQADVPLQVMAHSKWTDINKQFITRGECGPFTVQFTPAAGRKYQALFTFVGHSCSMNVQDITDSAAPAPVETKPLECKRPDGR